MFVYDTDVFCHTLLFSLNSFPVCFVLLLSFFLFCGWLRVVLPFRFPWKLMIDGALAIVLVTQVLLLASQDSAYANYNYKVEHVTPSYTQTHHQTIIHTITHMYHMSHCVLWVCLCCTILGLCVFCLLASSFLTLWDDCRR